MTCPYIYLCTQYEVLHTTTCLRAIHALNHTKNCSRQVVNCDKGDTWSSKHKYFRKNRQRTCPNPSTITSEEGEIRLEIYTNTNILNTVMSFTLNPSHASTQGRPCSASFLVGFSPVGEPEPEEAAVRSQQGRAPTHILARQQHAALP
jgi:hypothetical protein